MGGNLLSGDSHNALHCVFVNRINLHKHQSLRGLGWVTAKSSRLPKMLLYCSKAIHHLKPEDVKHMACPKSGLGKTRSSLLLQTGRWLRLS